LDLAFNGWSNDQGALGQGKTGANPTDRAKGGTKRSVIVEAKGLPLGLVVDGANRHDVKLTQATIKSIVAKRPKPTKGKPQGLCLDKGYDSNEVRGLLAEFGFTAHIRGRREEAQAIKRKARFKAQRWVMVRTHSWRTAFAEFSSAGKRKPPTTLPFCIWPAPSSLGVLFGTYRNRVLH